MPAASSRRSSRTSTNGAISIHAALARSQRARTLGRLFASQLEHATTQPIALLGAELRGPHGGCERILQILRQVPIIVGRAAHMASSASRSWVSARRTWLLTVPSGNCVASAIS